MTTQHAQLSEWWQTPSAQAAIERAKAKQREKILELRRRIAQRKAELDQQIWGEEVS
jgi:hypothetical protein